MDLTISNEDRRIKGDRVVNDAKIALDDTTVRSTIEGTVINLSLIHI